MIVVAGVTQNQNRRALIDLRSEQFMKREQRASVVAVAVTGVDAGLPGDALDGDGQLAASGSFDGTVKLWDVQSRACLRTLSAERRYEQTDITGLTGVTSAQRASLLALGAVNHLG